MHLAESQDSFALGGSGVQVRSIFEKHMGSHFMPEPHRDMKRSLALSIAQMNIRTVVDEQLKNLRKELIIFAIRQVSYKCHKDGIAMFVVIVDVDAACY
jgi:hypothetical protein